MVHVICIVSRFCNVIEVKVAVASWTLLTFAAVDWFTRHDFATACVAVAVNVRTTVEDFGDEPEMSVTTPTFRAKPFVVSSVSVGLPQSPFVAPVTASVAAGAVVPADMAIYLKPQVVDGAHPVGVSPDVTCWTHSAPAL
jgi:hypothetical protein